MKTLYYLSGAFVLVAIIAMSAMLFVSFTPTESDGQGLAGGAGASDCTVSTSTALSIGNQGSTLLLPSSGGRAWVEIQQPVSASNTVTVDFAATAVLNTGVQLAPGTASTTPDMIVFGLNTDMPYTGPVSAITNVGSTTVFVTECRY